ncbi:transglutaminase-like domain-containing protein [Echinicola jeungdonensis]|uniref:Transglutaminase-like domain-containing protein n=1 Tax=Echinicola jeungdonensis TaxID=709343 RepID=A0ABV5J0E1_9BACT|nr:transglutaminase-like domain-containing protein [Echinicola jeungdonensis]MDN3671102.1 transglutaminase-like domain-containing protein [Echinicola jeungdonensis]
MELKNLRNISWGIILVLASCNSEENRNGVKEVVHSDLKETKIRVSDIEEGIKSHIREKTLQGNGFFLINYRENDLQLKLVRVHTEYISNLGPNSHFACVDLADVSGDVYDVDFFLEGKPGEMDVTETSVHKLNGKPFYTWKQRKDKTWFKVPVENASSELLGVIEGEDAFEFRYQAILPEIISEGEMWVPIAKSNRFQNVEILSLIAPGKKRMIKEKDFGNTMLYLKLNPEHSGDTVDILYQVIRKEKEPYKAEKNIPDKYLSSNLLVPVGGRFQKIANLAIRERDSKLVQARALYDYVIDHMRYMKFGNYGNGDANYACDTRTGNCTEFHSFFISLARSIGIPARFSIGASIPSERNEGGIDGYHCWAEFYAEEKWWPVDISEGNKYTALATYYFGRHPANRIELSRGRDLEVEPGPVSGPINFHAYPVLEIGGKSASTQTFFSFNRKSD